jgi:topoisomerase-4 subunit B
MIMPETHIQHILEYYMGKNTMERQEFIINNLKFELDLAEDKPVAAQ